MITFWLFFQLAIAGVMLAVGAYNDIKTREIANEVWVLGGAGGLAIALVQYGDNLLLFGIHLLFAVLVSAALFIAWFVAPSLIGAADVKAIMALGLILSPLVFVNIFVALLVAGYWLFAAVIRSKEKIDWRLLKRIEAPFIPCLFVGWVVTVLIVLVA